MENKFRSKLKSILFINFLYESKTSHPRYDVWPLYMMNPSYIFRHGVKLVKPRSWLRILESSFPLSRQRSRFALSIKINIVLWRNEWPYLIQLLSNLKIYAIPKKYLMNIFTVYVIIQHYFIVRIYFTANSHWLGSAKSVALCKTR